MDGEKNLDKKTLIGWTGVATFLIGFPKFFGPFGYGFFIGFALWVYSYIALSYANGEFDEKARVDGEKT